ncbi:peptidase inhibitor family I36 protein [Streptomyces sp. NPDC097727]|uniref:peptidase inhibitor family I36 protein n=1 Tax=Streptomyces sp. NPDC097727 TaxID=3366092 RepID=UPI00382956DB
MSKLKQRLGALSLAGASAAAITLGASGTASADAWFPANSGSSACTSQYALCLWDQGNYQGSGIGVTWTDINNGKLNSISRSYGFMGTNISSVINRTGKAFCGAEYQWGAGSTFYIQPYGWYGGLGSWDNRIASVQTWPCHPDG